MNSYYVDYYGTHGDGTNIGGMAVRMRPGRGTGSARGGNFEIDLGLAGSSGTTLNTYSNVFRADASDGSVYTLAANANTVPSVVQGAAAQSVNLQEWKNSAGTNLAHVDAVGNVSVSGNIVGGGNINLSPNTGAPVITMQAVGNSIPEVRLVGEGRNNSILYDYSSNRFKIQQTLGGGAGVQIHADAGDVQVTAPLDVTDSVSVTGSITVASGVTIPSLTPTSTTNKLYNDAGTLYFNGSAVDGEAGGADTYVQFNNSGSFDGSSDLTWNGSSLQVGSGVGVYPLDVFGHTAGWSARFENSVQAAAFSAQTFRELTDTARIRMISTDIDINQGGNDVNIRMRTNTNNAAFLMDAGNETLDIGVGTTFTADASTTVPAIIQGAAAQSANLQEWQDAAGSGLAHVDSEGNVFSSGHVQADRFYFGTSNDLPLSNLPYLYNSSTNNNGIPEWHHCARMHMTHDLVYLDIRPKNGQIKAQSGGAIGFKSNGAKDGALNAYIYRAAADTLGVHDHLAVDGTITATGVTVSGDLTLAGGFATESTSHGIISNINEVANPTYLYVTHANSSTSSRIGVSNTTGSENVNLYLSNSAPEGGLQILGRNAISGRITGPLRFNPSFVDMDFVFYSDAGSTNPIFFMDSVEEKSVFGGDNTDLDGQLGVKILNATDAGITVRGAAAQSANLQEWKNSAGTNLVHIDAVGNVETSGYVRASGMYFYSNSTNNSVYIKNNVSTDIRHSTVAIGYGAAPQRDRSVLVGYNTDGRDDAVAMGYNAGHAGANRSVHIGYNLSSAGNDCVFIGSSLVGGTSNSVGIGGSADVAGGNNVGIGYLAEANIEAVGIGANVIAPSGSVTIGYNVSGVADRVTIQPSSVMHAGPHLLDDGAPASTTNTIYNVGGTLYFNGSALSTPVTPSLSGVSWNDFATNYSGVPYQTGTNPDGEVWVYDYNNYQTLYRLVPTGTPAADDAFYTSWSSPNLTGLIATRGEINGGGNSAGSGLTIVNNEMSISGVPNALLDNSLKKRSIQFVSDGGGSVLATGVKSYVTVPYNCTAKSWTILAENSGSVVVDIWKDTYANYPPTVADTIAGSEKPTISSGIKNQDNSLTTWTTALSEGDILAFNIDSVTDITKIYLSINVEVT